MATFASFRSHFSLGQYAFLWSITCLTCTAVIRDFGVPAKVHAGPYGSYDKCEIRLIRARAKNEMKWNYDPQAKLSLELGLRDVKAISALLLLKKKQTKLSSKPTYS